MLLNSQTFLVTYALANRALEVLVSLPTKMAVLMTGSYVGTHRREEGSKVSGQRIDNDKNCLMYFVASSLNTAELNILLNFWVK